MKIITIILALFISTSALSLPDKYTGKKNVWLSVTNTWDKKIYVKEGWLLPATYEINPGANINYIMLSNLISNLEVRYDKNGYKQLIQRCPSGNIFSTLTIVVSRSAWDANTPVCDVIN